MDSVGPTDGPTDGLINGLICLNCGAPYGFTWDELYCSDGGNDESPISEPSAPMGGKALLKITVPTGRFGRIFVPGRLYRYLKTDKEHGGVVLSTDSKLTWRFSFLLSSAGAPLAIARSVVNANNKKLF